MALEPGCYYVLKPASAKVQATRGTVASSSEPISLREDATILGPRQAPPVRRVQPSPRAQRYIDHAKEVLAEQPTETFVAWGLSESGDILFEHQVSQGIYNHATVEYKPILQEVGRSKAISLYYVHNHPDGSRSRASRRMP